MGTNMSTKLIALKGIEKIYKILHKPRANGNYYDHEY